MACARSGRFWASPSQEFPFPSLCSNWPGLAVGWESIPSAHDVTRWLLGGGEESARLLFLHNTPVLRSATRAFVAFADPRGYFIRKRGNGNAAND